MENKRHISHGKIKAEKAFRKGNSLLLSLSRQRVARERQWELGVGVIPEQKTDEEKG